MVKNRLLLTLKYLWEETDESHTVSCVDIMNFLEENGFKRPTRNSVYSDIAALQDIGIDINIHRGTQNRYKIVSRVFDMAELQLLVDAVQASQFISKTSSEKLVDKLSFFAGKGGGELINRKLLIGERPKSNNEKLLYVVNELQYAINHKRKVQFGYVDYGPDKKKKLRHGGMMYTVSPYSMLWNGDNYYMIGWSDTHNEIRRFRVDRIPKITVTAEEAVKKPRSYREKDYYSQIFSMFDGPECEVVLLCTNDLMNLIIDRFGIKVNTEIVDEEHFKVTTKVHLSNMFYGWICSMGGKIKLLGPEEAVNELHELLGKIE